MTVPTYPHDELSKRLHTLADPVDGPIPTAPVLRRGRSAVRRNRVLGSVAALSVLATAGVLGTSSGVLGHSEGSEQLGGPAGAGGSSISPSHPHKPARQHVARHHRATVDTSCTETGPQRSRELGQEYGSTLQTYVDTVVGHLDPQQLHMNTARKTPGGGQFNFGRNCVLDSLGTGVGYTSPGDDGLGEVGVHVYAARWAADQGYSGLSFRGWRPAASVPAGAVRAYVREDANGIHAAVVRADGSMVRVDADPLWANNSQTPVAHLDLTADQLLEAAADPRLQMP